MTARCLPNQLADGLMPALQGVDSSVRRIEHRYAVTATPDFNSLWLPTQSPVASVSATGDWRYDTSTMDFLAGSEELSTAGKTWSTDRPLPRALRSGDGPRPLGRRHRQPRLHRPA